ncbi:sigma 54-interacting transcriptional regulator [Plesiocystis pacifica]|uniref:sigma 54-interacting transcriptional regulator n=1 Tax=Plesiocystis pacifica TaxID=191768 RepID=UPI0005D482EF|nr:sigma-54-dependent Fis family transcriptional regulator [Plesiocystis pacifica]
MQAEDSDLDGLLHLHAPSTALHDSGPRVMTLDPGALGSLRHSLVSQFGLRTARNLLTRAGHDAGTRAARRVLRESPRSATATHDLDARRRVLATLQRLQGMATLEYLDEGQRESATALLEITWHHSYEQEQHVEHLGQSDSGVCWMLCGFISGFLSAIFERPLIAVEDQCMGKGDALCRTRVETRQQLQSEGHPVLADYAEPRLEGALARAREELREVERQLRARNLELGEFTRERQNEDGGVIARSPVMRALLDTSRRVAKVDVPVLLRGPTGSGKERIARVIHARSARSASPFVAINCALMSEQLLDSELFGHARGAFPGASRERVGLLEAAHTGTMFLAEIDTLSRGTQARLLEFLDSRVCRRLGEMRGRPLDLRIVSASDKDLDAEATAGRFDAGLLRALRGVELRVPALGDRPEDILALARAFLAESALRMGRPVRRLGPAACEALLAHPWPGNVRELQNAIERAVALARGELVEVGDLPRLGNRGRGKAKHEVKEASGTAAGTAAREHALAHRRLEMSLADIEREHILAVLDATGGNKAETARRLDIGTATLFRKLKKYRSDS